MSYRISALKAFVRERKKMVKKSRPLNKAIVDAMTAVMDNPAAGEPYHANLFGLFKFKFDPSDPKRPFYRLVYAHYPCCKLPECTYADVPLEEDADTCSGMIEFVSVANRKDAEALYKKDASYISSLLR